MSGSPGIATSVQFAFSVITLSSVMVNFPVFAHFGSDVVQSRGNYVHVFICVQLVFRPLVRQVRPAPVGLDIYPWHLAHDHDAVVVVLHSYSIVCARAFSWCSFVFGCCSVACIPVQVYV